MKQIAIASQRLLGVESKPQSNAHKILWGFPAVREYQCEQVCIMQKVQRK